MIAWTQTCDFKTACRRWRRALFFLAPAAMSLLLSTGCTTGARIQHVNLSLQATLGFVHATLPAPVINESMNGREITTEFYVPSPYDHVILLADDKALAAPERYYAVVTILGERRPYILDIRVYHQTRKSNSSRFTDPKMDQDLTRALEKKFRVGLASRREDMNIIDDFRAF